jgi:hypothetical protein
MLGGKKTTSMCFNNVSEENVQEHYPGQENLEVHILSPALCF